MSNRLGNPQPFFPEGRPSANVPSAAWRHGEEARERRQGRIGKPKRSRRCPVEERHGLPEGVDRPTIVALDLVGEAERLVRHPVQDGSPLAVASARAR